MSDNSRDIELSVLGCLFFDKALQTRIAEISPDDFYSAELKTVFEAMRELADDGNIDLPLVAAKLPDDFRGHLTEICGCVSTSINFNRYLLSLKKLSQSRRIRQNIANLSIGTKSIKLDELQRIIDNEKQNVYIKSYTDKAHADLQNFIDNAGTPKQRIKLGFPMLDKITGGLRVPSVMMIGAYPSVGKTAFALNIAVKQDYPVVLFSLEMSSEMIYERLISAKTKLDYNLFSTQEFSEQQKKEIEVAARALKNKHLYVFDDIYDVEGQSAVIADIKPKLVIVDYIQKVKTNHKIDSRRAEIDYISGMYKQIAKHNKCAVMLLSQISRIDRNSPNMSSLKESGALEADGDYVGILHRPYVLEKDNDEITPEEAYILIDKNKFGNTGKLNLRFEGKYQQFYEVEGNHSPPQKQKKTKWWEGKPERVTDAEELPFMR